MFVLLHVHLGSFKECEIESSNSKLSISIPSTPKPIHISVDDDDFKSTPL